MADFLVTILVLTVGTYWSFAKKENDSSLRGQIINTSLIKGLKTPKLVYNTAYLST